jgi:hypothetical protein
LFTGEYTIEATPDVVSGTGASDVQLLVAGLYLLKFVTWPPAEKL